MLQHVHFLNSVIRNFRILCFQKSMVCNEWITLFWDKLLVFTEAVGGVSDRAKVVYEEKLFKCIRFNNDSCAQYS